jgi:hypothetical protein
VSIILNTATGRRSIGRNAAIAAGSTVALPGLFASPAMSMSGARPAPSAQEASPSRDRLGAGRSKGCRHRVPKVRYRSHTSTSAP